ncbi:hypothetical protein QWI17_06145 [Gilvimarinus sp. SDUM040013]|uniref:Uncharacterized protein n=1 Tax=Gilvimarinus gilvus TaxID=3058038 RepID=A0ABU4S4H7_9GAMM|nr:hypothetical protein [Gilvimarinus sp. SDUM040013]MDO3385418.1 hypothetical protein [Gilvimarinus sp. SDUM040013]MDX6851321.1 hypothetical protein [Gilvimarinus sp. SDUM040013]
MTSVLVIAALVILATALVCYVFITQHIAKKKKQQNRVLKALKQRQQLFKVIVSELPAGYLPTEVATYVYRVLLNTSEQLAKLAPNDGYSEEFQVYSKQLEALPTQTEKIKLPPEKTNEARTLLQELGRHIGTQTQSGALPAATAKSLMLQLRRLMLQISVDSYLQQAKKAQAEKKLRLAIHFYALARKLLVKENSQQGFQKQIDQLTTVIAKLEQEHAALSPSAKPAQEDEDLQNSWKELEREDDDWKKKQVYD